MTVELYITHILNNLAVQQHTEKLVLENKTRPGKKFVESCLCL